MPQHHSIMESRDCGEWKNSHTYNTITSTTNFNSSQDPTCCASVMINIQLPFDTTHGQATTPTMAPIRHTQDPLVTGTSVLGIRFKDGVMIAADTLGSYGSLARFRSLNRVEAAGKYTVVGASGEYSDFQYIMERLRELTEKDIMADDRHELTPSEIHKYVTRMLYQRRNKFDPLWNTLVVAGFRDGQSYLGLTDSVGTSFTDNTIATGYGAYLAQPLLRKHWDKRGPEMSMEEAKAVLDESFQVLYYRDARSLNRIQLATVTAEGVTISEPYSVPAEWNYKGFK